MPPRTKKQATSEPPPQQASQPSSSPPSKPSPVKKRIVRNAKKLNASRLDEYKIDADVSASDIDRFVTSATSPTYDVERTPRHWVLPNKVKFTPWLDSTFYEPSKTKQTTSEGCAKAATPTKVDSIALFTHQRFIKDYMQFNSPYRGIIMYHGLGSGKTCASIAAAEILSNHMDVIVMTPASLRDNYLMEIRKCGRKFFNIKQHWVFLPANDERLTHNVIKKLGLDELWIEKNTGVWLTLPHKHANYNTLPVDVQENISAQVDAMIHRSFQFVNYNGLNKTIMRQLVNENEKKNGTKNLFDGKCVVIDEIHNLISQMRNGRAIGQFIYNSLMGARNCKLIFLSGTPMINYPNEIAYLINLLTGPQVMYEFTLARGFKFDSDSIHTVFSGNKYVDTFETDVRAKKVCFSLLPAGFVKAAPEDNSLFVVRETPTLRQSSEDHVKARLEHIRQCAKDANVMFVNTWKTKETTLLPLDEEKFNQYFVNFDTTSTKNNLLFMRRILGTVSFYNTYNPQLYPSVVREDVPLDMTQYQFSMYENERVKERKKENNNQMFNRGAMSSSNNLFSNVGQVYRFYSRAVCNFVFPKEIERVFPSSLKLLKRELVVEEDEEVQDDDDQDGVVHNNGNESASNENAVDERHLDNKTKAQKYAVKLADCMSRLKTSDALLLENVAQYSPKYKAIHDRITGPSTGKIMVYSQFRTVEGLGVFGMFLERNGWQEMKVVKNIKGEWDLNVETDDQYMKPMFVQFTGSNEESRILMRIFNSDFNQLPHAIRKKVMRIGTMKAMSSTKSSPSSAVARSPPSPQKEKGEINNHFGDIIKLIMITKSGAEGISLKNVRQVHVMEPYWNNIRIDQVIGRAVRTCSHVDLPPEQRNVHVYVYYMRATPQQLENSFSMQSADHSMTSDQHIRNMAERKAKIINGFLQSMKQASIDCALNSKGMEQGSLKCFSFPVNMDENDRSFTYDIRSDKQDHQYTPTVMGSEWKGRVMMTKKGNFLVRPDTHEVYDYDIYLATSRLVKVGVLNVVDGNKRVIVREKTLSHDLSPSTVASPQRTNEFVDSIDALQHRHCFYYNREKSKRLKHVGLVKMTTNSKVAPYDPEYKPLTNIHMGQRKLLLSEIQCITQWYSKNGTTSKHPTVLYIGAAPGTHLLLLSDMFPQVKFVLYDGAKFDNKLKAKADVFALHNTFVTTEVVTTIKSEKYKNCIFICDIRLDASDHESFEKGVSRDMSLQQDWMNILQPDMALLKFRLPYTMKHGDTLRYNTGKILYGIWPSVTSGETRLLVTKKEIGVEKVYDFKTYEEVMFFHNKYERPYCFDESFEDREIRTYVFKARNMHCPCYDCVSELRTLQKYSAVMKKDMRSVVAEFVAFMKPPKKSPKLPLQELEQHP